MWRISASTAAPGWLGMPGPGGDDAGWVAERAEGLRRAFGERWTPELDRAVPVLLEAGLSRRDPDDLLAWQVWPGALPVFAVVRARVVDSAAIPDWRESGAAVQPFRSATLGDGVQVSATASIDDVQPGAAAGFVLYAFDDGAATVVVSVEPTLAEVLALCMPGLRDLVDGIEVHRPDGSPFRGSPHPAFVADEAGWPLEEGAA